MKHLKVLMLRRLVETLHPSFVWIGGGGEQERPFPHTRGQRLTTEVLLKMPLAQVEEKRSKLSWSRFCRGKEGQITVCSESGRAGSGLFIRTTGEASVSVVS